jgi:hypothetical protein
LHLVDQVVLEVEAMEQLIQAVVEDQALQTQVVAVEAVLLTEHQEVQVS